MHSIVEQHSRAIFELCKQHQVATLYLFGSVLRPHRFHAKSDIDVLVSFRSGLSLEAYTDCYFNLLFALEDLLKRPIDMTTTQSLSNPYFIAELNRTKVLLYDEKAMLEAYG